MSYQPMPIDPQSSRRMRPRSVLLFGCGGIIAIFGLVCIGIVAWLVLLPEGGVKLNNELSVADRQHLAGLGIPRDSVLAFIDRSLWQDGTDLAILTVDSLIHVKDGHQATARLSDVEDVRYSEEPMVGHSIELDLRGGRSMKISIPALNGGATFVHQLNRALGRRETG